MFNKYWSTHVIAMLVPCWITRWHYIIAYCSNLCDSMLCSKTDTATRRWGYILILFPLYTLTIGFHFVLHSFSVVHARPRIVFTVNTKQATNRINTELHQQKHPSQESHHQYQYSSKSSSTDIMVESLDERRWITGVITQLLHMLRWHPPGHPLVMSHCQVQGRWHFDRHRLREAGVAGGGAGQGRGGTRQGATVAGGGSWVMVA